MSSDIAALAEHVKQHNAGRDSKRAQAPVRKKPASAEAKPFTPKKEEVDSDGGARERGRSRGRRRSTPGPGSSAGASSSSAVERSRVWSILDEVEDPPAQEDTEWDPITAEEERWFELEAAAVPAGTADAEEEAPLSARSVISSGSAFDIMRSE